MSCAVTPHLLDYLEEYRACFRGQRGVFRLFPSVDIVVDGEGELTFVDLLLARLDAAGVGDLDPVDGSPSAAMGSW